MANIKDQENTTGGSSIGFGDASNGRDYMVQGFKPSSSVENITHVSIDMDATGSKDLKIWIDTADANSEPDNGVGGIGGSTLIANADLSTSLKKFALSSSVSLTAGNQYVICAAPWDISLDDWAEEYRDWNSSTANPYANGKRVHLDDAYANPTAPDSGNADIVFETWGDEPVTGPANLKTVNTVAKASVKTKNGVAIGSVKTINTVT